MTESRLSLSSSLGVSSGPATVSFFSDVITFSISSFDGVGSFVPPILGWHVEISVNILKTVQDEQWKTNRESYMAYQMAAMAVTLNDLEGHSQVAGLFRCNPSNICAAFYMISTDSMLVQFFCISRASCSNFNACGTGTLHTSEGLY